MAYEEILYAVEDGIATITMHRPEKLNAFTGVMMAEMIDALDQADADDAVRCVIVTGAGRAFCAGADLSAGAKTFDYDKRTDRPEKGGGKGGLTYEMEEARDGGGRLTLRIFESLKPVIGAINGPAVGIGSTMTLAMDVRLASDSARMGFVFARRGIVPEACSSFFLPRVVGISQALEWCFSGRVFDAAEAKAGGLVKEVVPGDQLLARARELAREIADNTAPVSVALTRQMLWRGLGFQHPMDAHKVDSRAILSRGRSGDAKEGVTSFLEKRQPTYPDTVTENMPDFFPWWQEQHYV
jgi:enoyl-CoA hydratase/carnithine racemase